MVLQNLGLVFIEEGKYADANVLITRAAAIAANYYDVTHVQTARTFESLSYLSYKRGEAGWRRKTLVVLNLFESNLGADHPETVRFREGRRAMLMRWRFGLVLRVSVYALVAIAVIWLSHSKQQRVPPGQFVDQSIVSKSPD
jgi:hypothetical protein